MNKIKMGQSRINSAQTVVHFIMMAGILFGIMCNMPENSGEEPEIVVSDNDTAEVEESGTEVSVSPEKPIAEVTLNPDLFGIWKTSEVIGSGSGNNYEALASEAYIELKEDGSFVSWVGRAAGAGSMWEEDKENVVKGKWRYANKTLFLIDPASGEEAGSSISVSGNRFMLTNGGKKTIFEREEYN